MAKVKERTATEAVTDERAKGLSEAIKGMVEKVSSMSLQGISEANATQAHAVTSMYLTNMNRLLSK